MYKFFKLIFAVSLSCFFLIACDLKNQNAIVTGGSRGIGEETCYLLAKEGVNVAVVANQSFMQAKLVAEKVKELGVNAIAIQCDVSDPDQVKQIVDQASTELGDITILVNNAGVAIVAPAEDMSYETWRRVIDTNLTSVFLVSQAVGKKLIEKSLRGSIINISSICSHIVVEPQKHCNYNVPKGGVNMLTKTLAVEWAPYNIRVNSISPGYIYTAMTAQATIHFDDWNLKTPQKHMGESSDIAEAIVYLASNKAKFVTGSDWIIDGGYTCP